MKYTPLRSVYFMMPLGVLHYFSCYFSEKPPPRDFRSSISDIKMFYLVTHYLLLFCPRFVRKIFSWSVPPPALSRVKLTRGYRQWLTTFYTCVTTLTGERKYFGTLFKKMSESQTKAGNQRKFENLKIFENLKFLKI